MSGSVRVCDPESVGGGSHPWKEIRSHCPAKPAGITRQHLWSRIHHWICSAAVLRFLGKKRIDENHAVDSVKQRI